MNQLRYTSIVDALILLKKKNTSNTCSKIDASCISIELFNKLIDWGYIEMLEGNSSLQLTQNGNNLIAFNLTIMNITNEAVIQL
jgi:hypothetical protein